MKRRQALGLLGIASAAGAQAAAGDREKFYGGFKLLSYKRKMPDGTETDIQGPDPVGRITFDAGGRMSVFIMRAERPRMLTGTAMANATPDQLREMIRTLNGFVAYMGTFDVNESAGTVVYHVKAIADPASVGADYVRNYKFSGKLLHLSTDTISVVWEREPDK